MANLFAELERGFEFIGNGYALKKTSKKDKVQLYKNGLFIKEQKLTPAVDKRLFVIDLVNRNGVTKAYLARSLDISRQSINNWIELYHKYGVNGLINSSKDSWKKNPKRFTGNKVRNLEKQHKEDNQKKASQQLSISFEEEIKVEEKYCGQANDLYKEEFDYKENRYSGSMLYLAVLLNNFNFIKQLSTLIGRYLWIPLLFVMMHVNKIFSVEQLKTIYRREFGQIIGLEKLFHIHMVRENIGEMIELKKAGDSVKTFFKTQIIKGVVSIWRIFLDGHFVAYTGKEKVHKSYYTQRDMMMPGNTEFYGHDSSGNIVYFNIQEGKGDIVESLRQLSDEIKPYNNGIPPLVVVDRELWGVEKFLSLSEYRFVTWEKFCDKSKLKELPDSKFYLNLELNNKDYILLEESDVIYNDIKGNSVKLRRIIARNINTKEIHVIVTNDSLEDSVTIADSMFNRWGCSENGFKHIGQRTNTHYNPYWNINNESEKQDIYNPKHKDLKKQLKQQKGRLTKLQKELGKKEPQLKKDGTPRKSPARDKMIKKRDDLENEIAQLEQQIKQCPERISTFDIKCEPFKVIDSEAKTWWNISGMIFWNSRKKLSRLLFQYLPDKRDLLPVLEAITKSRGWIKSTKEMFTVRLEPLETPRFRDAQVQLCRHLNAQKIKLPNGKLLQYDVGDNPYSVKK